MNEDPTLHPIQFIKGRGAGSNQRSRFEWWARTRENVEPLPADEAYEAYEGDTDVKESIDGPMPLRTSVTPVHARSIISRNTSPDLSFDQSINPYQGCEHGCIYCFARPTHAYLNLSPGIDFETKIFAKVNAAELLRTELARKSYVPGLIALGANTDPYQPAERSLGISRQILQVLAQCNVPVAITTKSALVVRDLDILAPMAERGLVRVHMSIATLDNALARKMDPRANAPAKRLEAIGKLAAAGVPVSVFSSPMIPAINDVELEAILAAAASVGARHASMIILRLPLEVRDLFVQWLEAHYPLRARHVMHRVQVMRGGKDYDASFGTRMRGTGLFADLLQQRFQIACRKLGLVPHGGKLDVSQFRRPGGVTAQGDLFGAI